MAPWDSLSIFCQLLSLSLCDLNWGIFVAWFSCCQEMCLRFRWFLFSLMETNLLKSFKVLIYILTRGVVVSLHPCCWLVAAGSSWYGATPVVWCSCCAACEILSTGCLVSASMHGSYIFLV